MKKNWLMLILCVTVIQLYAQHPVSFPSEYIDFTIDSQFFSINGIYTFRNNTGQTIHHDILYPFATDISNVDSISIIDLNRMNILPFLKRNQDIIFNIMVAPFDSTEINIFFRQKTEVKNTYILMSTKTWEKPLEKAVYTLTISNVLKIKSFSIEPDSVRTDSVNSTYFWEKINFNPQTDFEIILAL
jgi:hypothetical protein